MKPETIQMIEDAKPIAVALGELVDSATAAGCQMGPLLLAVATLSGRMIAETAKANGLPPADIRSLFNRMVDNAQARSLELAAATRN